ncbi:MAG TPA: hypothetical protein PLM56_08265 [Cyclobacteriaceae bacterium]|jgi:galactokinase|nr:hypothetical protein [Cyclobacteriaceae bacterium]HRE67456.1 hypothetical protein [Cyclobacteriaceae bacterium]HRF33479.1 hypothetical protein [Cyclobacteriaceae bacterium]
MLIETSAPGRLDVMGGIADYSGSLVLQMPIAQQTEVNLTLRTDYICVLKSYIGTSQPWILELSYRDLLPNKLVDYAFAKQFLSHRKQIWAGYIVGCALVLQKEKGIEFTGANIEIRSAVPLGKGVSSSASVEVAVMRALVQAFQLTLLPTELPTLAQKVENFVVGAPCGLMDQLACHLGKPNHLLPIVCQPDLTEPLLPIPNDLHFVGIDSGVKHTVSGHQYGNVRSAAFMGYSLIAAHLGASTQDLKHALLTGERNHLPFRGYLCNISVSEFESSYQNMLPFTLTGKAFLEKNISIDPVTKINPGVTYSVRTCTKHPVYENNRVDLFRSLLLSYSHQSTSNQIKILAEMGTLMYASHESYSHCGLGSARTDEIVSLAKNATGIYGAKITGGGQGGTVCLLTDTAGKQTAKALHQLLCEKYKQPLVLF